jgi:5-methyltetrahydrofolate--homocysteine methyltransferase
LPLVAKYGAAVVGVANDETGIPDDVSLRFAVAKKIVERAEAFGIPRQNVVIDPLAMPVGAVSSAIVTFLKLVRRIREELGVNTICGASNISFGLPNRPVLGAAFLSMAIGAGLTCAITNPLESEIRKAILASDVMLNHDENCQAWLTAHRPSPEEAGAAGRRERRISRRSAQTPEPGVVAGG